jgi:hypothetical protein
MHGTPLRSGVQEATDAAFAQLLRLRLKKLYIFRWLASGKALIETIRRLFVSTHLTHPPTAPTATPTFV